jgi:hypothetical protein
MSSDSKMTQDSPLWVRILLKIPAPSFEHFSDRFEGYFWILIMPVFIFSIGCVNLLLITCFPSPLNAILFFSLNSLIVLLFMRILIERTLHAKKAILNQGQFRWDIDRSLSEYLNGSGVAPAPDGLKVCQNAQAMEKENEEKS